jgi:hypothetical protein
MDNFIISDLIPNDDLAFSIKNFPEFVHVTYKQGGQCTYDVTLRRVRVTIVAVGKQYVLHILSVCL